MANRDFKKIERVMKDFSMGVGEDESGGTTVVANPTLVGTEDNLTGLQVGETKYKVPQGGSTQHYHKVVLLTENTEQYCFGDAILLDVYIDTPESLTVEDVWKYIAQNSSWEIDQQIFVQINTGIFGTIYYDTCAPTDPLFGTGGINVSDLTGNYITSQLLSTQVTIAYDQYI